MFSAALLIGLREGLEASLIVGILLAYVAAQRRPDQRRRIWWGVGTAAALSLSLGALFTVGRQQLSFMAQEAVGGFMSLLAVGMVTWMVFWMLTVGRRIKGELQSGASAALATGSGWAMFWIAFVSVGREGVETTVMLWGWALEPLALAGALSGVAIAVLVGAMAYAGLVRLNYATFFRWTGVLLVLVAAGILAYGIHDLQEARLLPGPYSGHPITPTDLRTGEVLIGFTDGPFWMASFPFGWAFDVSDTVDPGTAVATFLRGVVGFTPQMSWIQVLAWLAYLAIVLPAFWRRARAPKAAAGTLVGVHAAPPAASSWTPSASQAEPAALREAPNQIDAAR